MMRSSIAVLALGLIVVSASAQTALPRTHPLRDAIASTEAAKVGYNFRFELTDGRQTVVALFNQRARQLQLLSPPRNALSNDLRQTYDTIASHMDGITWCARPILANATDFGLLSEDASTALYSFQPTRQSVVGQMRQMVEHLRGELTLSKQPPDVLRVRTFAPEAFGSMIGPRVERFDTAQTCALAPNGRRFASEIVTNQRFVLFGQVHAAAYVRRFSDLVEAR